MTRTSRTRRWRALGAAGAAALALGVTAPAFAADVYPSNGTFNPDVRDAGWSSSASSNGDLITLLTEAGTGYVDEPGNPSGSIQSSFNVVLNALNLLAKGNTSWTSPAFTPSSAAADATLTYDSNATIPAILHNGVLELGSDVTLDVVLKDLSVRTEANVDTLHYGADYAWATRTVTVDPSLLVPGHTYQLEFRHSFSALASVLAGTKVQLDNIALTVNTKK